jgi:hypothetical protein
MRASTDDRRDDEEANAMTPSSWYDDDALLAELREALAGAGPVPARMVEAARTAFAWRDVDRELELLGLVEDSALRGGALVRSVAAAGRRILAFQGNGLSLELQVGSEILGQVVPPQPCRVVLMDGRAALAEVDADVLGCFRLARPDHGPVRLTCRTADHAAATEWWRL